MLWLFKGWHAGSFDRDVVGRRVGGRHAEDVQSADRESTATRERERDREREWIEGLRAGSVDVFETVFGAYAHRLHHFARLWVPADVAEDIVQDVLFDMWQRRGELKPRHDNLTGYLFAAVRNRTIDHRRHSKTVERTAAASGDSPLGMGAGPRHPDADMSADELHRAVDAALATLSVLQRAVLMLRWGQDLPMGEIARILEISENAVKLHASRGRQALAPLLEVLLDR